LKDKTADPMGRLERDERQKKLQVTANSRVSGLMSLSSRDYLEDYATNSALRRSYRSDRKVRQKRKIEGEKAGMAVPMVDERVDDIAAAKRTKFTGSERKCRADEKNRMKAVRSGGIFGGPRRGDQGKASSRTRGSTTSASTTTSANKKTKKGKTKRIQEVSRYEPMPSMASKVSTKKKETETLKHCKNNLDPLASLADYGSSDSEG
jgi:hypothetical protein